jgi:hypothetical protein
VEAYTSIKGNNHYEMNDNTCPNCGSNQIHSKRKGYNPLKGFLGKSVNLPGGYLWGFHGRNRLITRCEDCGYEFNSNEYRYEVEKIKLEKRIWPIMMVYFISYLMIGIWSGILNPEMEDDNFQYFTVCFSLVFALILEFFKYLKGVLSFTGYHLNSFIIAFCLIYLLEDYIPQMIFDQYWLAIIITLAAGLLIANITILIRK